MSDETEESGNNSKSSAYENAKHWDDVFEEEFERESDRAAVILTASIFENSLQDLLKNHLVAQPSASDDLFDGANAPISTFSAKITLAYRLGLISSKFSRDLHLIRKIRNEFAHNVHGCTFEDSRVRSRVLELVKNTHESFVRRHREQFPDGSRGDFMMVSSWMLWNLNSAVENCEQLESRIPEFGYEDHSDEK